MSESEDDDGPQAVLSFGRMPADWGIGVSILGPGEQFGTRECFDGDPFVVWRLAVGDEVEELDGGGANPPGAKQKFEWHGAPDSAIYSVMTQGQMEGMVGGSDGPPKTGVLIAAQVCVRPDGSLEGDRWRGTYNEPDLYGGYSVDETFAYEIERVRQAPPDAPTIREVLTPLESVGGDPISVEEVSRRQREFEEDDESAEEQAEALKAAQEQFTARGAARGTSPGADSSEEDDDAGGGTDDTGGGGAESAGLSTSDEARAKSTSVTGLIGNIEEAGDVEIDVYQYTDARRSPDGFEIEQREVDVSDFDIEDITEEIEQEIDDALGRVDSESVGGTAVTETSADSPDSPVGKDAAEITEAQITEAGEQFDTTSWNDFNADCLSDPRYDPGKCGRLWRELKERGVAPSSGNENGPSGDDTSESEGMEALEGEFTHGDAVVAVQPNCPGCEVFLDQSNVQSAIDAGELEVINKDDDRWMDVMLAIGTDETPALGFYDVTTDSLLDEEQAAERGLL